MTVDAGVRGPGRRAVLWTSLAYGLMVLLLVVTLGLVPSVVGKAEWAPR